MSQDTERSTLAEKLNMLFLLKRMGDGSRPGNEAAEEHIRASGGPTISATYIWQLRKGIKDNPTKRHLEALAAFFGVPVTYFFDGEEAEEIGRELGVVRDLRERGLYDVVTRMREADLSPESVELVERLVEHIARSEGRQTREGGREREAEYAGLAAG